MNGNFLFFPSFLSELKHTINKTAEDTIKVFSLCFAMVLFTEVRIKFSFSLTHSLMQQKLWEHARAFSPALTDDQVLRSGLGISGAPSHLILTATPQSLSISSFLKTRELGRRMPGEPSRHHEVAGWSQRAARRPAACPGCTQRREPGTLAQPRRGRRLQGQDGAPGATQGHRGPVRRGRGRGGEQPGKQSQHRAHPHRFHPQTSHFQISRQRSASQNQLLHHFLAITCLLTYALFSLLLFTFPIGTTDLSTAVSSAPSMCPLQSQFLKIFAEHTNDCNVASSITETCQGTGQPLSLQGTRGVMGALVEELSQVLKDLEKGFSRKTQA